MSTGERQHLVPQMMIRRFAGDDGKLTELYMPSLAIGSRRRAPRGILFVDGFYRNHISDLDDELLTPIEQAFAQFYPLVAGEPDPKPISGDGGAALIDWIAAMLVRTRAFVYLSQAVVRKRSAVTDDAWNAAWPLLINIARADWFTELRNLLARPEFKWKMKSYRDDEFVVLSDHPVCQTNGLSAGG